MLRAALVAAAAGVTGRAGAGRAVATVAAGADFPQPAVLGAEAVLDVRFADVAVPGYGTVTTRTYNAGIPGPTLRVRGGDVLRLTQVNGLPPNPPHDGGHNRPHDANSFNLHTHGMHVPPSGDADNVQRVFVPRTAEEADEGAPEPQYLTTVEIPAGHPAGTYWYHPHLHGATATQLVGGMAGVLVVEGDVDEVPEIRAAADLVVCVNELRLKDGTVPDFTTGGSLAAVPAVLTVNGALNPVLALRPGEVQRWRLVAATAFTALSLQVHGEPGPLELYQIAQDGVTFAAPVARDTLGLAMGNRADVLVRGGEPGTYELRADGVDGPLMTVEVAGDPVDPPMDLPAALPQGKPYLDENDLTDPGADREVVFHVDPGVFGQPFPNAYRMLGSHPTPAADPGGDLTRDPAYGLFDPDHVNHTLALGTVERWTVRTDEDRPEFNHPFHLHTNHVLVTHRNGVRLDPPVWQDTIGLAGGSPGDSVTFLVKYEDFTGRTVAHCHQLQHEDLGMMQLVEYVETGAGQSSSMVKSQTVTGLPSWRQVSWAAPAW
ncbi:multicopper oxidase family protein [Streptomyces rubellomurinus]|uniref:multicopper oxidase family protein n=1 Tax=Streptomyces rubellomurinus (strain ATCC 31215) TaxID=359131 RepID=UPI0012FECE42|nr:multicopper oxidase domain-containing protein [Streptomyces rubellomurinus]